MKIYIDSKIDNEYGKEFDEEYFDGPFGSKSYNNKLYLRTYYNGKTSIYLIDVPVSITDIKPPSIVVLLFSTKSSTSES